MAAEGEGFSESQRKEVEDMVQRLIQEASKTDGGHGSGEGLRYTVVRSWSA